MISYCTQIQQKIDLLQYEQALALCEQCLVQEPDHYELLQLKVDCLFLCRKYEQCIQFLETLAKQYPTERSVYTKLAYVLLFLKRFEAARHIYETHLIHGQTDTNILANYAMTFYQQGNYSKTIEINKQILQVDPKSQAALLNLGLSYQMMGMIQEALQIFRDLLHYYPDYPIGIDNTLMLSLYIIEDAKSIAELHRYWANKYPPIPHHKIYQHDTKMDPTRKIRVAYVSPDFKHHVVSTFFEPILLFQDRRYFEIILYANVAVMDSRSERLKMLCDRWVTTSHWSDERLAQTIKQDQIDILIDLAGHTANNNLMAFNYKPAPIQMTYLGYPATTGLASIQYRITDAWADPPGSEPYHTETLLRMPHGFSVFQPILDPPAVHDALGKEDATICFGSFNNVAKISDHCIQLWSKVLAAVPGSKLFLKNEGMKDPATKDVLIKRFMQLGLDTSRVEFLPFVNTYHGHLEHYQNIYVALDTYPYHGTTTTCEALLMGVPVISLAGNHHASRVGVSLLHQVGHPEWVAQSEEEYILIAKKLVQNLEALNLIRKKLRSELLSSPLVNFLEKTKDFDALLIQAWEQYFQTKFIAPPMRQEEVAKYHAQALLFINQSDWERALSIVDELILLVPDAIDYYRMRSIVHVHLKQFELAALDFVKLIKHPLAHADDDYNYARYLEEVGNITGAISHYQKCLEKDPKHSKAPYNLALLYASNHSFEKAILLFNSLLNVKSGDDSLENITAEQRNVEILNNLGFLYRNIGLNTLAIKYWKKTMELCPKYQLGLSNYLFILNTLPLNPKEIAQEHMVRCQEVYAYPKITMPLKPGHAKIRLAYLSSDFKEHSVTCFIESILKNHNLQKFELFLYGNNKTQDAVTERLKSYGNWFDIHALPASQLADLINKHEIDILVDLNGHTAGNRLAELAARVAPMQITYLGYPNTTGLKNMDYRIVDQDTDPVASQIPHSETIIRLSRCFLAFNPPALDVAVGDLPALRHGYFTLGSFNHVAKINPELLAIWAKILGLIPHARLQIKMMGAVTSEIENRFKAPFKQQGIALDRIQLLPFVGTTLDHLKRYQAVDLCLDSYPYHGTTTSFQSLWMGVPFITLKGESHVSRVGYAILHHLGMEAFVANHVEEYMEKAVYWSQHLSQLAELRKKLRERLLQSSLCDGKDLTSHIEKVFMEIYQSKQNQSVQI